MLHIQIFYTLFQKIEDERRHSNILYEARIIPKLKPDIESTKEKITDQYTSRILMQKCLIKH